jgi:protein gp37
MSAISKIQWTDRTWNPVRGCSIVSPGCVNCYAMKQAHRFSGEGKPYHGLTKQTTAGPQWTGAVRVVPSALSEPSSWRKPARVFVNSMSDLFHDGVPDEFIAKVFAEMASARRHTFQVLTKRPERMRDMVSSLASLHTAANGSGWPLPNVWLGTSCEDQQRTDERLPLLLQTPAAVRFVSAEPLLSGIDIAKHRPGALGLHWLIAGGESGSNPRPSELWWFRNLLGQCRDAGVAFFMKQVGGNILDRNDRLATDNPAPYTYKNLWPEPSCGWDDGPSGNIQRIDDGYQGAPLRIRTIDRKGGDPLEWPKDMRVREFPAASR